MPVTPEQLQRILTAQEWDPFSVLGPHRESHGNADADPDPGFFT